MPGPQPSREEDLRRLLTDAIEVQLASLRAGIGFWSEWIEQTSGFVQSATKALSTINSEDQSAKDVLLEVVDAGRASIRSMTEIPRHTALRFIEELDKLEQEKAANEGGEAASSGGAAESASAPGSPGAAGSGGAARSASAGNTAGTASARGGARTAGGGASAQAEGAAPRRRRSGRVKP